MSDEKPEATYYVNANDSALSRIEENATTSQELVQQLMKMALNGVAVEHPESLDRAEVFVNTNVSDDKGMSLSVSAHVLLHINDRQFRMEVEVW